MTMEVPRIEHAGLVLRAWRDDDAPALRQLAADPVAWQWMRTLRQLSSIEDALSWIAKRRAPGRIDWVVCDRSTGEPLGRVALHHFQPEDGAAELGYLLWPEHRGRGVATEMVRVAAQHGFDVLGLHRISLRHAVGNAPSCAVAARAGFAFEGVERAALDHGDGVHHDVHRHARLATDPPGPADPAPRDPEPVPPATLTTERFLLRPPTGDDAAGMLPVLADPETMRWNPVAAPMNLDRSRRWCVSASDWGQGGHATFVALDRVTGELVGNVALHRIDRETGDAEIGYRVAPAVRGQGVATELLTEVTRWAFDVVGLHRVYLMHAVDHPSSCRVAEKAGFRLEGVTRQSYRYGDGHRHDEHLHARLAGDPEPLHPQRDHSRPVG